MGVDIKRNHKGCEHAPLWYQHETKPRLWSTDRCALMVMSYFILKRHHRHHFTGGIIPERDKSIMIVGDQTLYIGDAYPISLHMVRAVEYKQPLVIGSSVPLPGINTTFEQCRLHIGVWSIWFSDGGIMHCSKPREGSEVFSGWSLSKTVLMKSTDDWSDDITDVVENGDAFGLTYYEPPVIVEGFLDSKIHRCGAPV